MDDIRVKIDKRGRVVLPKSVRQELAIQPGDMLKVTIHGNKVALRPQKNTSGFIRKGHVLVFSSGGGSQLDRKTVDNMIAEDREIRNAAIANQIRPRRGKP